MSYNENARMDDVVLGIDLGSCNSSVSYYLKDQSNVYSIKKGELKTTPTCIAIDCHGVIHVGLDAIEQRKTSKVLFIDRLKQLLINGDSVYYNESQYQIQHLISELFLYLKRDVELKLNRIVSKCVLTVPANFSESTRHVLKDSAIIAGLDVLRVINEPTAAAVYFCHQNVFVGKKCLFVDVGGLTLDMTLCSILDGVIDVIETSGSSNCGHKYVDQMIHELILRKIYYIDPALHDYLVDDVGLNKYLLSVSQRIKERFSDVPSEEHLERLNLYKDGRSVNLEITISKKELYQCYNPYMERFSMVYDKLLQTESFDPAQIDHLILIGGPANSSFFRTFVEQIIKIPVVPIFDNIFSVSRGAALYGAFIIGHIKNGNVLSDVNPLSIGVEMQNGVFYPIIKANTKKPCVKSAQFTTIEDFQTGVKIKILEGQRLKSQQCTKLGEIFLKNIEIGLRGEPRIFVGLEVTEDGTVNAFARDHKSNKNAHLKIKAKNRLDPAQVEQIKLTAMKHRKSDELFVRTMNVTSKIRELLRKVDQNTYENSVLEERSNLTKYVRSVLENQYTDFKKLSTVHKDLVQFYNKNHCSNDNYDIRVQNRDEYDDLL